MILMGKRSAKERHDSIAHNLIDGSLKEVHGLHHVIDDWIEEFPRVLRVTIGKQFHGSLHVGKQNRDLLTLTFERALGWEDFFGEVFRCVDFGRRKLRGNLLRRSKRLPAPSTKLFSAFV